MPEDLRVAYRILKNGGFVPAEVETLNQIAQSGGEEGCEPPSPQPVRHIVPV